MRIRFSIAFAMAVLVTGCAIHPLQEDVTRIDTYIIVQKIRCEARSAVIARAVTKDHQNNLEYEISQKRTNINTAKKNYKEKLDKAQTAYIHANSMFQLCKKEGDCSKRDTALKNFEQSLKDISEFTEITLGSYREAEDLLDRPIRPPVFRLNRENDEDIDIESLLARGGGTTDAVAQAYANAEAKYAQIKTYARTYFLRYVHKNISEFMYGYIRDTAIAYEFKFTINEGKDRSVASSFLFPFSNGKFGIDFSFGEDRERQSERGFDITEYFTELLYDENLINKCNKYSEYVTNEEKYPITGKIGLDEVINTYLNIASLDKFGTGDFTFSTTAKQGDSKKSDKSEKSEKKSGQGDVTNFTDVLTYTTSYGGSLKPALELSPVTHDFRLVKASGSLGGDRKDVHKVGILLSTMADALDPKNELQNRLNDRKRLDVLRETGE